MLINQRAVIFIFLFIATLGACSKPDSDKKNSDKKNGKSEESLEKQDPAELKKFADFGKGIVGRYKIISWKENTESCDAATAVDKAYNSPWLAIVWKEDLGPFVGGGQVVSGLKLGDCSDDKGCAKWLDPKNDNYGGTLIINFPFSPDKKITATLKDERTLIGPLKEFSGFSDKEQKICKKAYISSPQITKINEKTIRLEVRDFVTNLPMQPDGECTDAAVKEEAKKQGIECNQTKVIEAEFVSAQ